MISILDNRVSHMKRCYLSHRSFYKPVSRIFLLILVSILVSCASKKVSDQYQLQSVESADSSKRFTYGFYVQRLGVGSPSLDGENRGSIRSRPRDQTANFEEMRQELKNYMAITGYCSEGYFIYDETFNGSQYLLHGECQESK